MKRETVNYTLVGLVVLVAIGLLIAALFAITGRGGASTTYLVRYQNVTGLASGAPVFYEGYRIGQVGDIMPERKPREGVSYVVELDVRKDWPIPADSVARLASSGLLADVSIAIREGDAVNALKPGNFIKGEEAADVFAAVNELASEVTVLTRDKVKPLIEQLGVRLESITKTIDDKTPALIEDARVVMQRLAKVAESADELLGPKNRGNIEKTLANLAEISGELKGTQERLDAMLTDVQTIAAENRPTIRQAVLDLSQITSTISRRIDSIAHHLESSSRNLDEFSREIRSHPNRLIIAPKADKVEEGPQ